MKAIVIGATGATGRELVKNLIDDKNFSHITVLSRRKFFSENPKLTEHIINFEEIHKYKNIINADVAFSCLGTTLEIAGSKENQWKVDHDYQLNFAKVCSQNDIPTFVLLSAMNSNPKSKIFYSRMKGKLENEISKLKFRKLIIVQPSLIIRPKSNRNGEKFAEYILKFLNKLNMFNDYKPITCNHLSKAMISSVNIYSNGSHKVKIKEIFQLIKT